MSEMLGKRIAKERRTRNMLQADLANKLDVSKSTIGMWETGQREPDTNTINKIADLFGVTTDYLLGRSNDPLADDGTGYVQYDLMAQDLRYFSSRQILIQEKVDQITSIKKLITKTEFDDAIDTSDKNLMIDIYRSKIEDINKDIAEYEKEVYELKQKELDNADIEKFNQFINDPSNGQFFKEFLGATEERKEELLRFWRYIQEANTAKNTDDQRDK